MRTLMASLILLLAAAVTPHGGTVATPTPIATAAPLPDATLASPDAQARAAGILALAYAPGGHSAEFGTDALTRGQPLVTDGFVGLVWMCDAADEGKPEPDGEQCYAGIVQTGADRNLETGP